MLWRMSCDKSGVTNDDPVKRPLKLGRHWWCLTCHRFSTNTGHTPMLSGPLRTKYNTVFDTFETAVCKMPQRAKIGTESTQNSSSPTGHKANRCEHEFRWEFSVKSCHGYLLSHNKFLHARSMSTSLHGGKVIKSCEIFFVVNLKIQFNCEPP